MELAFKDDFEKDSRSDYKIEGVVAWESGKLVLGAGATVYRALNAGAWVEMDLNLEIPALKNGDAPSEVRFCVALENQTDCMVSIVPSKDGGDGQCQIAIYDTNGEWSKPSGLEPIGAAANLNDMQQNGKWRISYRYGCWSVTAPNGASELRLINNGNSKVTGVVLSPIAGALAISRFKATSSTAAVLALSVVSKQNLTFAEELDSKALALPENGEFSDAITVVSESLAI